MGLTADDCSDKNQPNNTRLDNATMQPHPPPQPDDDMPGNQGGGETDLETENSQSDQGAGNLFCDPRFVRSDCRAIGRAIRERWKISRSKRRILLRRLFSLLEYGDDRQAISAAKIILQADSLNIAASPQRSEKPQTVNLTQVNLNQSGLSEADKAALASAYRVLAAPPGRASDPPK